MKIRLLWVSALMLFMVSCLDTNEFPDTPSISYDDIKYVEVGGFLETDSLILRINFEDGDGDLGLRGDNQEDRRSPYNDFSLFSYDPDTRRVVEYALDTLSSARPSDIELVANSVVFSDRRNNPDLDTLPDYTFPEYCKYYRTIEIIDPNTSDILLQDTAYYNSNPRFNNIYVRFFIENNPGSGDFEEFFWEYSTPPDCNINYHGRFPLINEVGRDKASEGVLTYRMTSIGWRNTFQNNRVKLRVFIYDRAGNKSNEIETPPFRLDEIQ
jgi:hypothetical protein